MIWVAGRIIPDEALSISVLDRTFEHGLGLFETLRTWSGHPTLLDRHLARLTRSAGELGLPLDRSTLPDARSVADLLAAGEGAGDALLRITLTGGTSAGGGGIVWMQARPLPPPTRAGGAIVETRGWTVAPDDPLARHKSLNYWGRRLAYERAREGDHADEGLGVTEGDGCVREGSRTNLFLIRGGTLATPNLCGRIVPGIMRGVVLEHARRAGLVAEERPIPLDLLPEADEIFLTNSVRGILPVAGLVGGLRRWSDRPITGRLWAEILPRLHRGVLTP